ncbi:unannotated protein [freshwater metagenome]|uniref:Unannotated protein n=1 Tax=freshwater metagenome TaxID=449393 RepID=A0A6J6T4S3_9ZZZZ
MGNVGLGSSVFGLFEGVGFGLEIFSTQTNFLPVLVQVNLELATTFVSPFVLQVDPALIAALAS